MLPALVLLITESLIVDAFVAPVAANADNECRALAAYAKFNLKDSVNPMIGEDNTTIRNSVSLISGEDWTPDMMTKFRWDCHEAFALKKVMEKSQAPCAIEGIPETCIKYDYNFGRLKAVENLPLIYTLDVDNNCPHECGYGEKLHLLHLGGLWFQVRSERTWVS